MKENLKLFAFTILVIAISTVFLSMFQVKRDITLYFVTGILVTSIVFLYIITTRIHEKYLEEDPVLVELKEELRTCFPEIDNTILLKGKKSYTINKKRIHICLKDEKGEYYNKNMLIYVLLHECAHVICDEVGHTEKFHDIFQELLMRAINAGVYNPSIPVIQNYCNHA